MAKMAEEIREMLEKMWFLEESKSIVHKDMDCKER